MRSYPESIEFLYGLQHHGIKLGLETTEALLSRMGAPHRRYPSLHVGGTNGKGATAAMGAAVLQTAGYRVGLYTSPHLVNFRERIRVNGELIAEERVADLVERVRVAQDPDLSPTFFEFTTAMAFQYFAEMAVDVAVCEVGMGGRFDATNVLRPVVSAITNVSLDHQAYLGTTVGAIAGEKAGIIKEGIPLVVGRLNAEAAGVIGPIASERSAPWSRLNHEFRCDGDPLAGFHYTGLERAYSGLVCPLPGAHQLENAACALAMLERASGAGLHVSEYAVRAGLRDVSWEGRLERVEDRPLLLLDGAHNPGAAAVLVPYLAGLRRERPGARIFLVLGMMRDKDREGFARILLPLIDEVILTQAQHPRAATVQELRTSVGERAGLVHEASLPADALTLARRLAEPDDVILVTGSLMLVGDVKALQRGCWLSPLRG
jgi:dihydrofolate synthase/folylpolyglutamate synthase